MAATENWEKCYDQLADECENRGWTLEVESRNQKGVIQVIVPGTGKDGKDMRYSRTVEAGESYDRCAWVILRGLRKSKVL